MSNYGYWEKAIGKDLLGELENLVYIGGKHVVPKNVFKEEYDELIDKIGNQVPNDVISNLYKIYSAIIKNYEK